MSSGPTPSLGATTPHAATRDGLTEASVLDSGNVKSDNVKTVAFIGLGNMGFPMAGHLVNAGFRVRVFNRTQATAQKWLETYRDQGECSVANNPAEACEQADFVALCLGDDDSVRSVCYGESGVLSTIPQGALLVDHTTASANLAYELAQRCEPLKVGFIDAPISGGQSGAKTGELSVMCGANQSDFEAASNYFNAYATTITRVGPVGHGQLTKMCNQILCAGAIAGAAEAIAFGQKAGLDMQQVLSAVTKGAAGSWYLQNRGETMVADQFDFGFAVDWLAKDLGIVLTEANDRGSYVPLTALMAQLLAESQADGDNRSDATVVVRRYRKQNGL